MAINWPGLMAWSTQHHDGTKPSEFKQLNDEDRAFLTAAFEEAFGQVEDANKIMFEAIQQIKSEERTDTSIVTALEIIDHCCDDPDVARNAEKLDGIQTLLDLVGEKDGPIRVRALEILALLMSNNPDIQGVGMKRGALAVFLGLVKDCPAGSEERTKAFRALVALVRQVEEYEDGFLRKDDGVSIIAECMGREEDPRTREKAMGFVTSLGSRDRLQKEDVEILTTALVPLFEGLEGDVTIQYKESLASCSLALASFGKESPQVQPLTGLLALGAGPACPARAESVTETLPSAQGRRMAQEQAEALKRAVVTRLVALKKASDTADENEIAALIECKDLLSK